MPRRAGFGVAGRGRAAYLPAAMPHTLRRLAAVLPLLAAPASAQQASPRLLGEHQSWTAAVHTENGQKVCYAFARASRAEGAPGREAGSAMLIVTHRPGSRDEVALRSGFPHGRGAEVTLAVGQTSAKMHTNGSTAFVPAGEGRAVAQAMRGGREAVSRGPGPNGRGTASETFPLAGFAAAHDAIGRECPAAATTAPRR